MMDDITLALMTGVDIPLSFLPLVLHQPTIQDISRVGTNQYMTGAQTLVIDNEMLQGQLTEEIPLTNFKLFMMVIAEKEAADKKKAVITTLSLLFPNYKIVFTPNSMLLMQDGQQPITIDDDTFQPLQKVMKRVFCFKEGKQETYNPANEKARQIAEKIMRGRQRVAAQRQDNASTTIVQYLSVLSVALHTTPMELQRSTLFTFYDLVERYSLFVNWDLDVRARLAGGKPDGHPQNWMKNLHNTKEE